MRVSAFLLAACLLARPVRAQFLPPTAWWHESPSLFENAPTSHLFGGMAWNAFVRGPWIAKSWRNRAWKRVALSAVGGAAWESFQVLETKNYPWRHGWWDWQATLVGAVTAEALMAVARKL